MNHKQDDIIDAAARRVARSNDQGFSPSDRKRLGDWLEKSPEHRAAFEEIQGVWNRTEILSDALKAGRLNVQDFGGGTRGRENPRDIPGIRGPRLGPVMAAACFFMLMVFCFPLVLNLLKDSETVAAYTTDVGEQRRITLEDGSTLEVNVDSRFTVRMGRKKREVAMAEGEIFFKVAPDPDRPFEVTFPTGRVLVLGTAFNIKNRRKNVAIDVDHGRVRVQGDPSAGPAPRPRILTGGHGVDIRPGGQFAPIRSSRIEAVLGWQKQRVSFKNTPVQQVLDELCLYHKVRIGVDTTGFGERGITGTFDMGNLDQTLGIIAMAASLKIDRAKEGSIRLYK